MRLPLRLRRVNHRHILPDLCILIFALSASIVARVGLESSLEYLPALFKLIPLFLIIQTGTFVSFGVYDIIWRYTSVVDAVKLFKAVLLSSVFMVAATYLIDLGHLPRSTFFIYAILSLVLMSGIRLLRRVLYENSSKKSVEKTGRLTVIYGAGTNGRALANRLNTDSYHGLQVVGFVDDDPQKLGRRVSGIKVLGTGRDLAHILRVYQIQELILATGQIPGDAFREVVQTARTYNIRPRLFSDSRATESHQRNFRLFREIELSDLLNRPARTIDLTSVREMIRGKRVLVSGAGGSIGSELARQIHSFKPAQLVLLDHSEFNLYQIDQELRAYEKASQVVPVLADIKDIAVLGNVMREYLPEIVFHAAAYKHVHLVESNPFSSILNNVLGTRNLLNLSLATGVETFLLISTDKAVNPIGIMGATKRACELMVCHAAKVSDRRYCAVRFGNVLGSSGSLIPLLQKQIQNGEPVTITHEDMTRYFMLIPEAVSLVLKAATISQPGNIAILRMGNPIRIVEVARSLIALMGKTEAENPIVFTGLRPGEKMFEELYLCGNELNTEHPDILVLPNGDARANTKWEGSTLASALDEIIRLATTGDKEAVIQLRELISPIPSNIAQFSSPDGRQISTP